MTHKEFQNLLKQQSAAIKAYITGRGLHEIGNTAVQCFKSNFQTEGYFGSPWQRSKKPQGKTLTQRGDLGRSIEYRTNGRETVVYSDLPYSRIHNEGGFAGRNRKVRIPKRQFMGESPNLNKAILTRLNRSIMQILTK